MLAEVALRSNRRHHQPRNEQTMQTGLSTLLRASALGATARTLSARSARGWPQQFGSSAATDSSAGSQDAGAGGIPKLVVLGGRGFVGSHVCHEALNTGLHVLGVSRSGTPPLASDPWVDRVEWVRGNALEPRTYEKHLQGALAVISCIGAFGSQAEMLKLNGTANVMAIEAAKAAGVPRFVFISANVPNIPGLDMLIGGYIRGKAQAEQALQLHYPHSGVALRPGVVYGNRVVSQNLTLPLQYAFQPVEILLGKLPPGQHRQLAGLPLVGAAFVPPTSVEAVARAAVRAATDSSIPAGVMDVWELQAYK